MKFTTFITFITIFVGLQFTTLTSADHVCCSEVGFAYIPETGICVRLHRVFKTWHEANATCVRFNAKLLMISDQDEFDAVKKYIGCALAKLKTQGDCGYDNQIWIGANDIEKEGDFRWTNGEALTTWQNNKLIKDDTSCPNSEKGADCALIRFTNNQWDDRACERKLPFACQMN